MANGKISEYLTALGTLDLADKMDVSELVSTGPDVWATTFMTGTVLQTFVQANASNFANAALTFTVDRVHDLATNTVTLDNGKVIFQGEDDLAATDVFIAKNNSGTTALKIQNDSKLILKSAAVVADADLANSEYNMYIDETSDLIKGRLKDSGGVASDLKFDADNIGNTDLTIASGGALRTLNADASSNIQFQIKSSGGDGNFKVIADLATKKSQLIVTNTADGNNLFISNYGSTNAGTNAKNNIIYEGGTTSDALLFFHRKTAFAGRLGFGHGNLTGDADFADVNLDLVMDRRQFKVSNGTALVVGPSIPMPVVSESDSGTTDGTTANKLVDSTQNFVSTAAIGMTVENTTDSTFALVTAVDSNTTLSLSADIMISGESYIVGQLAHFTVKGADDLTASINTIITDNTGNTIFEVNNGQEIGMFGAAPVAQTAAYTITNPVTRRSFDTTTVTLPQLAEALGTAIADLKLLGPFG